jgi:hypothetical protein
LDLSIEFSRVSNIQKAFHVIGCQDDWKSVHIHVIDKLIAVVGEFRAIDACDY